MGEDGCLEIPESGLAAITVMRGRVVLSVVLQGNYHQCYMSLKFEGTIIQIPRLKDLG